MKIVPPRQSPPMQVDTYIKRETVVNVVINTLISPIVFWIFFGHYVRVPVWGVGNWLFDFIPQSFMIAFMSVLVPGALAARAVNTGQVRVNNIVENPVKLLVVRAVIAGVASAAFGSILISAVVITTELRYIDFFLAMTVKVIYSGFLAYIIARVGLRLIF